MKEKVRVPKKQYEALKKFLNVAGKVLLVIGTGATVYKLFMLISGLVASMLSKKVPKEVSDKIATGYTADIERKKISIELDELNKLIDDTNKKIEAAHYDAVNSAKAAENIDKTISLNKKWKNNYEQELDSKNKEVVPSTTEERLHDELDYHTSQKGYNDREMRRLRKTPGYALGKDPAIDEAIANARKERERARTEIVRIKSKLQKLTFADKFDTKQAAKKRHEIEMRKNVLEKTIKEKEKNIKTLEAKAVEARKRNEKANEATEKYTNKAQELQEKKASSKIKLHEMEKKVAAGAKAKGVSDEIAKQNQLLTIFIKGLGVALTLLTTWLFAKAVAKVG